MKQWFLSSNNCEFKQLFLNNHFGIIVFEQLSKYKTGQQRPSFPKLDFCILKVFKQSSQNFFKIIYSKQFYKKSEFFLRNRFIWLVM